ncbi:MAG: cation-transporting P-type ATPase, partial [Desulfuromonadales bacterium]
MTRDVAKLTSPDVAWHALHEADVLARTRSCRQGLTSGEAAARLGQYGPNLLPGKSPPGLATIFVHQFLSPLIYILIVAGLVSLAIGEWTDGGFIFAVILLNAMLGTFQEWKAECSAA